MISIWPLINGFEVTQKVLEQNPAIKIIGISVNNHPSYVCHMLELGAKGYLTKGSPFDEISKAILEVKVKVEVKVEVKC